MSNLTKRLASLPPEKRVVLLAQLKKKQAEKTRELILPQKRETNEAPLSFAQQRLWFLNQLEPQSAFYNISNALYLSGHMHVKALDHSLARVIQRHEVLRTTFEEREGPPVQVIAPSFSPRLHQSLSVIDVSGIDLAQRDQLAHGLARQEAAHPFSLTKGPLLRAALLRLDLEEHLLLLTMHHIVSDGWSMGILQREIARFLQVEVKEEAARQAQGIGKAQGIGQAQGTVPTVVELPIQYADYALWQRKFLQGAVLQEQIDYWQHHLAGAPGILHLPTDRPRPPIQTYAGDKRTLLVPPALVEELKALSQREETTLFMTLLAAFNVLLMRYSGQQDIVVGIPIANRTRSELKDLIGFFVNTLAVRTDLSGNPSFRHLLARVRDVALQAFTHQDLPFEKLVEVLPVERHLGYSPLFQVLFVMQNFPRTSLEEELSQSGLSWRTVEVGHTTAKFDLECHVFEARQGLEIVLIYNTDLFMPATIKRLLANFQTLLKGVAQNPQARLFDLPLLTDAEREQLLVQWNATKTDYPQDLCVHQLFEQQVERTPDAVALVFEDDVLTYYELNRRANHLGHYLQDLGIGPDEPVGICMQRCLEMALAVLAVLKAGGTVVPIDPTYPQERITYLLADAQIAVLLMHHQVRAQLPDRVGAVACPCPGCLSCASTGQGQATAPTRENCPFVVQPEHLCYTIYTSGSTGTPKGVGVPHRVLVNLLAWHRRHLLGGVRTLQFARLSFDASFHEMFAAWCTGGMLFLLAESIQADVEALALFLQERAIEKVILPVVMLHQLAALSQDWASYLKEVTTTGEQLQITPATSALFEKLAMVPLHNHYGPSETHVVTAHTLKGPIREWPTYPPIGRPIANTDIYLLDSNSQPVPIGAVGELSIGGVSLARGYTGRADLTAERFVPHPFVDGERLYKTGDLARYLPDGTIEYLGRIDTQQVKLRGYRIELGEIESVLHQHPAVDGAIVLVHAADMGEKQLVAYVVRSKQETAKSSDLRKYLQARLPNYMVPSHFVLLDALPLSPNSKVDLRALPKPDETKPARETAFVAPRTAAEEVVALLWCTILGVEQIGVHDNFFALGGHSLLAAQLASRLRKAFQVELPLRSLFEKPTVEGLVNEIADLRGGRDIVEEMALIIKEIMLLSEDEVQDRLSR